MSRIIDETVTHPNLHDTLYFISAKARKTHIWHKGDYQVTMRGKRVDLPRSLCGMAFHSRSITREVVTAGSIIAKNDVCRNCQRVFNCKPEE